MHLGECPCYPDLVCWFVGVVEKRKEMGKEVSSVARQLSRY